MVSKQIIQKVSRSFSLSLFFLPKNQREAVTLAYLLARYGDTLVDSGSCGSATRLADLESFENAIMSEKTHFEKRENPTGLSSVETEFLRLSDDILKEFCQLPTKQKILIKDVIKKLFLGMKWDLRKFSVSSQNTPVLGVEDDQEFDWYCYHIAGCVGEFWVKIFDLPVELTELAVAYGKGLQRINIYRDAPEDLARGRIYFSRELLSAAGVEGDLLWKSKKWSQFSALYLDQTEKYLREGISFGNQLSLAERRLRWASFIPCAIGLSTLQRLKLRSLEEARIKISRADVRRLAAKAAWKVLFRLPFSSCASQ